MWARFEYETTVHIGRGSNATVYRARRLADGRDYAIKATSGGLDARGRALLANEALLLAALDHPHIVAFKEAFLSASGGRAYLVTELLTGGRLRDLIREEAAAGRHLPEATVWRYFLQLAAAVAHLHAAGVVHRDLKPCNVQFADTTRESLKLLDFGLACSATTHHALGQAGTPMYAAPEVYSRQPTGLPSDVWGLGCVLHELCALRPAFQAGTIRALRAKVLLGSTAPIPEQYSAELRGVLGAMLQPDPAQRITMAQLLAHPAVAPRLAQLQRAGVVGMAPGAPSPPLPTAPPGSELSLDDLQRLLPAPLYGHPCNPAPHTPDPLMSAWFRTDSALDRSARASSPPAAPAPRSHDQALPPARPAIQRQLSRSLHNVGAAEAPAEVAKLPVKLHPKYAALAAAALEAEAGGLAPKRPGRPGVAASQAPATPRAPPRQPSRPLSKTGSGASAASTPRRPATSCSGLQARALEARIDAVRRSGSGAAALAAAVRDSLAESDAQMVLQLTSRLSRLRSAGSPAASGGRESAAAQLVCFPACPAILSEPAAGSVLSPPAPVQQQDPAEAAELEGQQEQQQAAVCGAPARPAKRRWTLPGFLRRRSSHAG